MDPMNIYFLPTFPVSCVCESTDVGRRPAHAYEINWNYRGPV